MTVLHSTAAEDGADGSSRQRKILLGGCLDHQRARRERKIDAQFSCEIHYPQQHSLASFQLGGEIRDHEIKVDQNIQAAFAKIVKADVEICFVGERMIGDQLLDLGHQRLDFRARGVVGDLNEKALAAHCAKGEVLDRRIDDGVVGIEISELSKVRIRVLRKPTSSTVPSVPDTRT